MTTIEQAFIDAVLADIAYVDGLVPGLTGNELKEAIKGRISEPLANTIGYRFEVIAVRDDPVSDYQGVVFRDKVTNELYLANRGTESLVDILMADADLVLLSGIATSQTAAMVNWWEQISRPAGSIVPQINGGITSQFERTYRCQVSTYDNSMNAALRFN